MRRALKVKVDAIRYCKEFIDDMNKQNTSSQNVSKRSSLMNFDSDQSQKPNDFNQKHFEEDEIYK